MKRGPRKRASFISAQGVLDLARVYCNFNYAKFQYKFLNSQGPVHLLSFLIEKRFFVMCTGQTKIYDEAFLKLLIDLIEIADSFDQLNKIALLGDMLYSPNEPFYQPLYYNIEQAALRLRGLPYIGLNEVVNNPGQLIEDWGCPAGEPGNCGLAGCTDHD